MKKILIASAFVGSAFLFSCGGGEPKQTADEVAEQQAADEELIKMATAWFGRLPEIAENSKNPITEDKVLLGRMLYFDTRLSKNGNISCNSCHNLNTFGVDNEPTSPGDDGIRGGRNTPTVFNAALHAMQFWDGRASDVEEQAGMPILNPIEHGIPDQKFLEKRLSEIPLYQELFAKAFPEDKNPISFQNLTHAIAAFERKLITPSRIDDFIAGNANALNTQEKRGLKLFQESGCNTCHIGPAAGGMLMQKFGVFGDYWTETKSEKVDEGRFEVTQKESDKYIFKVPSLRNIEKTFPYFHDGSVADLGEAVRIMAKLQQNKELSQDQVEDLVAFLKTFTGDISEELKTPPAGLEM